MARLDDERCWGNPMSDAESDEVPADALRQLLTRAVAYVEEKVTRRLDAATASHASVYAGRGGIALFFLRLAQLSSERGQAAAATTLLQRADAELDAAQAARHGTHGPTFLEGSAGVDALRAAVATAAGRHAEAALAAARVAAAEHDVARLPKVDCELLYGRAGYLHACLVARAASGASAAALDAVIVRTVEAIVAAGAASADEQGPAVAEHWGLLYTWHDAEYLGAAHGLAGIVATVLQAEAALAHTGWRLPAASAARLRTATLALAAALLPSGNLPTRARGHVADDRLVQWCHGAPGLLMLAPQAVGAYHRGSAAGVPLAAIAVPLAAAADCVWQRGLLHKGTGLCHGVSGNAYAFLAHWRAGGDACSLRRARAFASWCATHLAPLEPVPDRPHSLYEGAAGFGVLCIDLLRGPASARMPGAELPL